MSAIRFAVIGIDHDHIFGQCQCILDAGAELVAYHAANEHDLLKQFMERFPDARRVDDPRRILEDPSIHLVVSAAVNADRADIAIAAMRHGKDAMVDKPGITSLEKLAEVRKVQAETGRIFSILYSEHFEQRSTVKAGELVQAGAIGKVIHTTGLGPHRIRKPQRPAWFFERARYGGILADIGSHQCEQFLFFTNATSARVLSATVANRGNPDKPELQDFGDMHLATDDATGYVRVDWFTPHGLPVWGDGRLIVIGTEGMIELRKYIDVAGRPGPNHLFLTDAKGVTHIDCNDMELPYGRQLLADIRDRTETAMTQAHCFAAMELALTAQAKAEGKL
ncbi:Gfo/Idh/MocA family protein [Prosthecomicrobium sp. N25]|uniref:Gfo/Idh/MocA family protein n=1 Tax=Prosthecomicrobium sp. N25 TaxID=3129254 RepID=UPI0030787C11